MGAVRKPGRRFSQADLAWPALLLLFTVGATAGAVAASNTHHNPAPATTAAPPVTTTATTTAATTTQQTTTTATATTTATTTQPAKTVPTGGLTAWPAGVNGYTDVLESIPVSAGRAFAASRALAAKRQGLPAAGVLASSDYPSLHGGYYVVFSGIYRSSSAAAAALAFAHAHGFADAYQARVAR